jgi:hypothetical protein
VPVYWYYTDQVYWKNCGWKLIDKLLIAKIKVREVRFLDPVIYWSVYSMVELNRCAVGDAARSFLL